MDAIKKYKWLAESAMTDIYGGLIPQPVLNVFLTLVSDFNSNFLSFSFTS